MARVASRLPAPLVEGPFRVAVAIDAGVGIGRLNGPDLDAALWGVGHRLRWTSRAPGCWPS